MRAITRFDYILIDCPPSLNLLTVNAMVAAHSILVPLQSEFFALEGLSQLMLTIREVRQTANPNLRIEGVVLTMYDGRNNLVQQVEAGRARQPGRPGVQDHGAAQCAGQRGAVLCACRSLDYDPASKGSQAYRALARELLARDSA